MNKKIIIPLPTQDFDPTEAAIPWKILTEAGVEVFFATPEGRSAQCDLRMLQGNDLGLLAPILQADKNAQIAYQKMSSSQNFLKPMSWNNLDVQNFDGILLPGGHAKGMKEYLESSVLQKLVTSFFDQKKIIGAICHGVVLAVRSKSSEGKSVLFGKKTTSLLKSQELTAWGLTCLWLKDYYRTYPETVEDEVRRNLKQSQDFISGPTPMLRDNHDNLNRGFCVVDENYVSARWPGDAHRFGMEYLKLLNKN